MKLRTNLSFVPRIQELLSIEGNYDGIILSCRHKDILRASVSKHFSSCFQPERPSELQPILYCYRPEICIIGRKDKSGDWIGRVFGFYDIGLGKIKLAKVYGNKLSIESIKRSISQVRFIETCEDLYFPVPT